jgi:putative tryptophan/tyrosine transport system substrate-binding protein
LLFRAKSLGFSASSLISPGNWPRDRKAADRRIAAQIVEILNGGKPAEMPYFQENHWELVINLKAAKELGLEIPARLIAGADRVIE